MSIAPVPEPEQGELFQPKAFTVVKEQIALAGGAITVNNDAESQLLRSLDETEQVIEVRAFCSVKGFRKEYGTLTWNLVVADAVIDTD